MAASDWLLAQELFEQGDPGFVDALRRVHDAEALGAFARPWFLDTRPASRQLLLDYLDRPLNAFRHEPLVKRLFKLAEAAGDDAAMARFLVALDRSVGRVRKTIHRYEQRAVGTEEEARKLQRAWHAQGFDSVNSWQRDRKTYLVWGLWSSEGLVTPGNSTMPREKPIKTYGPLPESGRWARMIVPEWAVRLHLVGTGQYRPGTPADPFLDRLARFRLFSVSTRSYLRRRAWRYFRRLGRQHPGRYVPAIVEALVRYEDADVKDGAALLDRWGLVHALFHHSPALLARSSGWVPAPGHGLAELAPAPMFERLWQQAPAAVLDLLRRARCRTVRRWALRRIEADPSAFRPLLTLERLLDWLGHADPEVVALASDWLQGMAGLDEVEPGRWLALLDTPNPAALDAITSLMGRHLRPERIAFDEAVRLASRRPVPVARLGLEMLRGKVPATLGECEALLALVEAESEPVRPELLRWARGALSASEHFRPEWVLEYLDSRHADARAEGWSWLRDEPRARDDVALWGKLLESPYDDVRLPLLSELRSRLDGRADPWDRPEAPDPDHLRLLWASVLLNIHRGSRSKPVAVRQVLRRLERRPDESPSLLPLLAVALRSVRGPEWRAGLAAVVKLVTSRPETGPAVRSAFPELQWS